jgi:hypothetical protein
VIFVGNKYKSIVVSLLKNNPEGLTIKDFVDKIGTSRHTISLSLAELKGEGRLSIRKVGMAKLHFLKQND